MIAALAYTVTVAVIVVCIACGARVLPGHQRLACLGLTVAVRAARALLVAAVPAAWAIGRIRAGVLRARWAWRCRGLPARNEGGPLEEWEREELITIRRGWKDTARPERSRT